MNSDIIFTDTHRAVNQTKGREEMEREKPTIKNNLTNAIKTDLHFKDDIICFDKNRWSIKKLADYIILHRGEIGLYKKSDFEIDEKKIKKIIKYELDLELESTIQGAELVYLSIEIAKAIVKKNPIKIKGEK